MEYEEAAAMVSLYVAKMEHQQIEIGNEQFRFAYISGALQSMLTECIAGYSDSVERQIKVTLKTHKPNGKDSLEERI